jgi:hypothetical protein
LHVTSEAGKHYASPGNLFTVAVALRPKTLEQCGGFCGGAQPCQADDRFLGDAAYFRCSCGGLRYAVLLSVQVGEITLSSFLTSFIILILLLKIIKNLQP